MSTMSRLLHALARSRKARQTSSTSSSLRKPSSKSVCTAHQKIQGYMCQVCRHSSGSPAGQVHPPGGDVSLMAAHPTARQIKGPVSHTESSTSNHHHVRGCANRVEQHHPAAQPTCRAQRPSEALQDRQAATATCGPTSPGYKPYLDMLCELQALVIAVDAVVQQRAHHLKPYVLRFRHPRHRCCWVSRCCCHWVC